MNNIILEWKQIDINSIAELDDTNFMLLRKTIIYCISG